MRQGPNVRRMRGRSNGRKHVPLKNQSIESSGPDVKVRGNASQVFEKYLALARDATSAGDRIAAEGYFQHAEHYYRLLRRDQEENEARRRLTPQNGGMDMVEADGRESFVEGAMNDGPNDDADLPPAGSNGGSSSVA